MVKGILLKNLLRELLGFKAQIFSIAIVVGIGVGVYFGFSTTYRSLLHSRDTFYQQANFPDLFANLQKAPNYLLKQLQEIEGVETVERRIEQSALINLNTMDEPAVGSFISIPNGEQPKLSQLFLIKGKMPDKNSTSEVVISESFFKFHHLALGDEFFATLNGKQKKFSISGVGVTPEHIIAIQPGSPMPDDRHFALIWTNQSVLESSLDMQSSFNSVAIKTSPQSLIARVKKEITTTLERYGVLETYGRDKQLSAVYVSEELKQLSVQANSIPILFFLVAAFILNIVISRLIRSQRSQIATLKAVGFKNITISQYYLTFATLIVFVGTIIGIMIGLWIGKNMVELYGLFYHFPLLVYKFSLRELGISVFFAFSTAFLGTFSALKKVYALQPAEAMRPPTPMNYHNSLFEKFGLLQVLTVKGKMIMRGVMSTPTRSLMVGLGASFSIVLLIIGLFWGDSLDSLISGQYSFRHKETGSIQLTKELQSNVVYQVNRIPGIIEAEGYRSVPIKIYFDNQEETSSILGYPKKFRLKGIINQDFQEIRLPQNGLHVGDVLAAKLGLTAGDEIEIEILAGRKTRLKMKVVRILQSFSENAILTRRSELAKIMKTDDLVNQIVFRSYGSSKELYTKLKEIPTVLSVSYKDAAMKMFTETSAKFLLVFAFIFSVFAGAIAFGISYNNLRVTLSERDWEVSTLMILGLHKGEVFRILIAEVITLIIVFIPLGWVMGYYNARWLLKKLSMEQFPIPFNVSSFTYLLAALVVFIATSLSCWLIYRRLKKIDLVSTLKSRA